MLMNINLSHIPIGLYNIYAGGNLDHLFSMSDSINLAIRAIYNHVIGSFDTNDAFTGFNSYSTGICTHYSRRRNFERI